MLSQRALDAFHLNTPPTMYNYLDGESTEGKQNITRVLNKGYIHHVSSPDNAPTSLDTGCADCERFACPTP